MNKFFPIHTIERIAQSDLHNYRTMVSKEDLSFPLEPEKIFKKLFGLTTHYQDFEEIGLSKNGEEELLGALYPEGHYFDGECNLILVNSKLVEINQDLVDWFAEEVQRFTIFHEGGHYALHFRPKMNQRDLFPDSCHRADDTVKPPMCRTGHVSGKLYDPLEFQANRYAAAMMMPAHEVYEFLGTKKPVDLRELGKSFKRYFGVSQMAMERRLIDLEYQYINGKYDHIYKKGVAK